MSRTDEPAASRESAASRAIARRILDHTTMLGRDADERPVLELFYSLVVLLPPTEIGADVLATARSAATGRPSPLRREAPEPESQPAAGERRRRRLVARSVRIPLPAFIVLALALVFTTTLLLLPRGHFEPSAAIYLVGTGAARSARGVALLGLDELQIFTSGLSRLERGYRYVAWDVDGATYNRLGTMTSIGNDRARLRVPAESLPRQLEVTIEPSTSIGTPSGPTVLAGFLGDE